MTFKKFIEIYDDWNGITKVNDDNLDTIVVGKTFKIMYRALDLKVVESYDKLFAMEVVAFGFYDNELCIRVK